MKKLSLVFAMVFLAANILLAQRTITGKVTDANSGEGLISASVTVQGTLTGTTTDLEGNYSITMPEGKTVLVFSYTGFTTQNITVGADNVLDVQLVEGITVGDVVVTALGIKREKKTLGYATQEVGGDEVTRVKDANFINSLSGKVAGVDIRRSNQMGGSSNVIIRGYKSLTGNNQALFVVDGVPISNENNNTTDQQRGRGGYDYGNAAMDINPEDIASINVLKGAAATALYGSRAANGVVLVTTKRGTKGKSLGISVASGLTVGTIDKSTMIRYQNKYGQGYGAFYGPNEDEYFDYYDFGQGAGVQPTLPTREDASFGPAFDPNVTSYDWRSYYPQMTEWYGKQFPLVAAQNTPISFYETATTYNTNVAITGGTDKSSYRLSYTNFNQSGILPNSKIGKNTVAFSGGYDITPKLKATSSINYVATEGRGRYGTGYSGQNVNQSFRQWYNVGADIADMKMAYEQTGLNITWNPKGNANPSDPTVPAYTDNFYFMRNESYSTDNRSRMFGNVVLEYEINDWLDLTGRVTTDRYSELQEERIAVGAQGVSSYGRFNKSFYENNFDLFLKANKYFGDGDKINVSGLLGTNLLRTGYNSVLAETNGGLSIPGLYALSNSVNAINAPEEFDLERAVNGFYAQGTIGYDNMLYLDLTARKDYSSTLPSGANGYFYPSASLSFIFSELMANTSVVNFGKLRLNFAKVGNGAPPYSLEDIYDLNPSFNTPLASAPSTANNPKLKEEKTRNYEAGLDMYFLDSKIHLDASIYRSNSFDQIMPVSSSASTGRLARYVNVGDVQNQGVELALTVKAIKTADFSWDIGVNWARNRNKVIALADGQDNFQLASAQGGITLNATVGESFGSIWGSNYVYDKYDADGNPTADAKPVVIANPLGGVRYQKTTAPETIGNINPDWKGGISNRFTYKSLAFSFLIDCQKGGQFFSLDTWYGYATGLYDFTAETNSNGKNVRDLPSDDGGYIIDGAVIQTGTNADGTPIYSANTEAFYGTDVYSSLGYVFAPNAYHIWDATFVKLREVSLTYSLPASAMSKTPFAGMNVSLIGRNLWIIYKASTYSDPESGLSAGNLQGNQSGAYPAVKEVGLNVNFKF